MIEFEPCVFFKDLTACELDFVVIRKTLFLSCLVAADFTQISMLPNFDAFEVERLLS